MWGVSSLDYDDDEELTRLLAVWDDEPLSLFLMNTFLLHQEGFRNLPFTVLRLSYAYRIFAKMLRAHGTPVAEDFMTRVAALARDEGLRDILGQRHAAEASRAEIAEALERVAERCDDRHGGSDDYVWLSRLLDLAPNYRQVELFQLLEKESRGQSRNSVWHLLRMDTVSATKFYEAFVSGCLPGAAAADGSGGGGSHYTGSRAGVSPGIQFGIKHEGLVKTLVECYVMHGREPVRDGLGLLIDPTSGLLGASMDLCFGVLKQGSGRTLLVEPCARVYEIKCRYKYLRKRRTPLCRTCCGGTTRRPWPRCCSHTRCRAWSFAVNAKPRRHASFCFRTTRRSSGPRSSARARSSRPNRCASTWPICCISIRPSVRK